MARRRKNHVSPYVLLILGGLAGYTFAYRDDPQTGALVRSALQTGADSLTTASIAVGTAAEAAPAPAQPMPAALRSPPLRFVTAETLNVRAGPGDDRKLVAQLVSGAMVRVLGHASGWSLVILSSGTRGWVASAWLGKQDPRQKDPKRKAPTPRPYR